MAIFTKRLTAPSLSDKHYIHYTKGGYNTCIMVNKSTGYVMPNCVGYAQGRLLEILQMTKVNWSLPACNAEDWYDKAKENGLQVGQVPKLGAVVCWRAGSKRNGSDGCGHVAVVEEIKPNGDIVVSNSGWGGPNFYTKTITKESGYQYSSSRPLEGFIYCGIEFENDIPQKEPEQPKPSCDYKKGDVVRLNTGVKWATGSTPALWVFNKDLTILRVNNDILVVSKDGISGGVTGTVYASDVHRIDNTPSTPVTPEKPVNKDINKDDEVMFTGNTHYTSSYNSGTGKPASPCKAKVTAINNSTSSSVTHKYHVVGDSVHGWVNPEDVTKLD